ncbi:phosphotransferase [Streptomyces mangrovisoli]|uniref:Aminoglycoside phosphotransferase n=1 Tax=Streptomyces mangrovisoli TaxID=1428628 RepID=A0A1J4NX97_9ACTN|nr:phosphotransferase [Streptomyces mangrovisoli]OIJ66674.1 aminoglycoside phosphotransferase [Streptomyces mangrovisoli]
MTADLLRGLAAAARAAAHRADEPCTCPDDGSARTPAGTSAPALVDTPAEISDARTLADRPDGTVVRHGGVVAKAHAPDTDRAGLAARLAVAARLDGVLLAPLDPAPAPLHDRLVTLWPYGTPVDPDDPDAAPWEAAAGLLARLHRAPAGPDPSGGRPLPPMRGPVKAVRAIRRMAAAGPHPAAPVVLRAWAGLPGWARDRAPMPDATTLCHGDLHLGQLVRHPAAEGPWRLIDVDDLGVGVAAWDLARPAAWYACGLLPPDAWTRFLDAYRAAGGPAVPAAGDPWPALDVPARALTVQTAALAVAKAVAAGRPLDEVESCVIDACDRMSGLPPELDGAFPS